MRERELDDAMADEAFIEMSARIAFLRRKRPDFTNMEIAYALLQSCVCMFDAEDEAAFQFLHEALNECINQEYS